MRRDIVVGFVGAIVASYFIYTNYQTTNRTYRKFEISPLLYKPDIIPVDTKKLYTIPMDNTNLETYSPKYKVDVKPPVHQDSYTIDTYMELPLETDGKTHETDVLYKDIEEMEPIIEPVFIRYLRFHCTEIRNSKKSTVHLEGFRFYQGTNLCSSKPIQMWNPHEGTTKVYNGDSWSDSDQRTVIFKFSEPVIITQYEIKSSYESKDYDPIHWKLEGSMSASFWEVLDDRTKTATAFPIERGKIARYHVNSI